MKIKLIAILLLIFILMFLFGCQKATTKQEQLAIEKCKELCEKAKQEISLNSQCLSDIYAEWQEWQINDWVCDIAHWPRQEIDNLAENQCQSYRQGKAQHFVELTPNCSFIRAI